jgi:site-specific DNA-methyltransferase (adenine-specific)
MWDKISKIIKDDTPIILFGNEPFSSKLRLSNINMYKYDWKWNKVQAANFLNVKYQPLKNIEDIMVFSLGRITNGKRKPIKYNPQGFEKNVETKINSSNYKGSFSNSSISKGKSFKTTGTGYPKCLIEFNKDREKLHPTQKPVALLEYLVKTYTNEGDIILDFTMGSGTTGIAAKDLNRKFIGIELEKEYFDISIKRLKGEIT